jgi:hypothetical protein
VSPARVAQEFAARNDVHVVNNRPSRHNVSFVHGFYSPSVNLSPTQRPGTFRHAV